MARERAERSLEEAQITIRDLQTKLAHERLAKDEALEAAQQAGTASRPFSRRCNRSRLNWSPRGWHSGTPRMLWKRRRKAALRRRRSCGMQSLPNRLRGHHDEG
jgi:hypothetical protein